MRVLSLFPKGTLVTTSSAGNLRTAHLRRQMGKWLFSTRLLTRRPALRLPALPVGHDAIIQRGSIGAHGLSPPSSMPHSFMTNGPLPSGLRTVISGLALNAGGERCGGNSATAEAVRPSY